MPNAFCAALRAVENVGASFFLEREVIGRETVTEQTRQLRFIDAVLLANIFPTRARARPRRR